MNPLYTERRAWTSSIHLAISRNDAKLSVIHHARRDMKPALEIKRTLDGRELRFECELVAHMRAHTVLRYVVSDDHTVAGLQLSAGTISYGVFWRDRPYNLYWWVSPQGFTIAYYNGSEGAIRYSLVSRKPTSWYGLGKKQRTKPGPCRAE